MPDWAAHDVAVHVAAGRQRAQQHAVDGGDGLAELPLGHAVELKRLPRGQSQRAVGVLPGQVVQRQPLRGGDDAARHPDTHHELVGRLEPLPRPLLAKVAIVLLIGAVKLEQLGVALRHGTGQRIGQRLGNRAPQITAGRLDLFLLDELLARRAAGLARLDHVDDSWRKRSRGIAAGSRMPTARYHGHHDTLINVPLVTALLLQAGRRTAGRPRALAAVAAGRCPPGRHGRSAAMSLASPQT